MRSKISTPEVQSGSSFGAVLQLSRGKLILLVYQMCASRWKIKSQHMHDLKYQQSIFEESIYLFRDLQRQKI